MIGLTSMLLLVVAAPSVAESYALLVGVSNYRSDIQKLEGPSNDIPALQRVLRDRYGVRQIQILKDATATSSNILKALRSLAATVKEGDFVFFYFSGHGTQIPALANGGTNWTMNTSALVPSNAVLEPLPLFLSSILIGSRDLRPILDQLDSTGATAWVVFDACFSEKASRSGEATSLVGEELGERFLPAPRGAEKAAVSLGVDPQAVYPYRRILYLSASGHEETAKDIQKRSISYGRRTVDGLPHGAFTNALLEGLAGRADANADGMISYSEVHRYVSTEVKERWAHTPMLFPVEPNRLREEPVFGLRKSPAIPWLLFRGPLRVLVEPSMSEHAFEQMVSSFKDLADRDVVRFLRPASNGQPSCDLVLRTTGGMVEMSGSSVGVRKFGPEELDSIHRYLRRASALSSFPALRSSAQPFGVDVKVFPTQPIRPDEIVRVTINPQKLLYPLLVRITNKLVVQVLYPTPRATGPVGPNEPLTAAFPAGDANGLERLFFCGFQVKTGQYESLSMEREMSPDDPAFKKLQELILAHCDVYSDLRLAAPMVK